MKKVRRVNPNEIRTNMPLGGHGTPSTVNKTKKKQKETSAQAVFKKKR